MFNVCLVAAVLVGVVVLTTMKSEFRWKVLWSAFCVGLFATGVSIQFGSYNVRLEAFTTVAVGACLFVWQSETRAHRLSRTVATALGCWLLYSGATDFFWAADRGPSLVMLVQLALAVGAAFVARQVPLEDALKVRLGTRVGGIFAVVSILIMLGDDANRLKGLAFEPNIMGSTCVAWLGLCLAHAWIGTSFRLIDRASVAALVVSSLLTTTRAAWIGLALIGIFYLALRVRKGSLGVFLFAPVGLALASALGIWILSNTWGIESWQWRLDNLVQASSGTGEYRLTIWQQAWQDIRVRDLAQTLTGTGSNSFSHFHPVDPTGVGTGYLSSLWLGLLYDGGVIGLLLFLLVVVAIVRARRFSILAISPALISLGIAGMFTNMIWFAFPWCVAALLTELRPRSLSDVANPFARQMVANV